MSQNHFTEKKRLKKINSPAQEARANGLHLHGFGQYQDHTGFQCNYQSGFSPVSFSLVQSQTTEATDDALAEWVQDLISQGNIFKLCKMLVAEPQGQAFVLCIL